MTIDLSTLKNPAEPMSAESMEIVLTSLRAETDVLDVLALASAIVAYLTITTNPMAANIIAKITDDLLAELKPEGANADA